MTPPANLPATRPGARPDTPGRARRTAVLALALAALLGGLLPSGVRAEDAPAPAPAPQPAPAAGPSEEERASIKAMVDELRAEAARIRGLAWKFEVPADLVSRKQMREDFMKQVDEEYPPAKRDRDIAILRRTGLLGPDQDLIAMFMDFMEAGVAGYYDPKKKHLRIVEGLAGPEQKPTILHELIHALEDQYYDLEKRIKPHEDDSDRMFAEKCITEGSAEHARVLYEAAHPDLAAVFARARENPKAAEAQMKAISRVPAWIFVSTLLHYQKGPAFAQRQVRGGSYPERIHELYMSGPVSQEQVLHPVRWFGPRQDWPQKVEAASDLAKAAGEGWSQLHALPSGELDLSLTLDFFLSPMKGKFNILTGQTPFPRAEAAAEGWDAGYTWVLKKEGAPLVLVEAYAFDTPADTLEAMQALLDAAKKAAGSAYKERASTKEGEGDVPATWTVDYDNQHGQCRLEMRGQAVLRVDGASPEVMATLWPVVAQTRFVRDPRDTWQPGDEAAALNAATFVDKARGIGLTPPSKGWTVRAGGANPRAFATATHAAEGVEAIFTLITQEVPVAQLLAMTAGQLAKEFPGYEAKPSGPQAVGDHDGQWVPLGTDAAGRVGAMVLASGNGRTLVVRISAPSAEVLEKLRGEVKLMLESVVTRE